MNNNYLDYIAHHGVRGQRWGVRRYQNPDGSLTEAGKARYNEDGTPKNAKDMTDAELASANKRLQAESSYNNMSGNMHKNALNKSTAVKAGISALATFLVVAGGAYIKKKFIDKENLGEAELKKIKKTGLLSAGISAIVSAATSFGGNVRG